MGLSGKVNLEELNTRICPTCGIQKPLTEFGVLRSTKDGVSVRCRACSNAKSKKYYWTHLEARREYSRRYNHQYKKRLHSKYQVIKDRARHRNIDFSVSREEFIEWFNEQKPHCYYCGQKLEEREGWGRQHNDRTIDRMDTRVGYTLDNMAFCCRRCNTIKGYWFNEREMLEIADKYLRGRANY